MKSSKGIPWTLATTKLSKLSSRRTKMNDSRLSRYLCFREKSRKRSLGIECWRRTWWGLLKISGGCRISCKALSTNRGDLSWKSKIMCIRCSSTTSAQKFKEKSSATTIIRSKSRIFWPICRKKGSRTKWIRKSCITDISIRLLSLPNSHRRESNTWIPSSASKKKKMRTSKLQWNTTKILRIHIGRRSVSVRPPNVKKFISILSKRRRKKWKRCSQRCKSFKINYSIPRKSSKCEEIT